MRGLRYKCHFALITGEFFFGVVFLLSSQVDNCQGMQVWVKLSHQIYISLVGERVYGWVAPLDCRHALGKYVVKPVDSG